MCNEKLVNYCRGKLIKNERKLFSNVANALLDIRQRGFLIAKNFATQMVNVDMVLHLKVINLLANWTM